MIPTIIIASVIAVIFIAIVANEIRKKKKGIPSCSCGGNCAACGICPHQSDNKEKNQEK
jgi:hypothetical protein